MCRRWARPRREQPLARHLLLPGVPSPSGAFHTDPRQTSCMVGQWGLGGSHCHTGFTSRQCWGECGAARWAGGAPLQHTQLPALQPGGPVSPLFTEKGSAGRRRGSEAATARIGLDQQPCVHPSVHLSGKGGRITPQAPPLTKSSTFVGRSWWVPRGSPEGEGAGSPRGCAVLVSCRLRAPGTAMVPGWRPRFCGLPTVGTEPGLWPPLHHPPCSCEGPG